MAHKLFLRWEIDLHANYLNRPINTLFDAIVAARACNEDLRNNEFRRSLGLNPHPDERGELFLWQDTVDFPSDSQIPDAAKEFARQSVMSNEAGLDVAGWKAKYPLLFPANWQPE